MQGGPEKQDTGWPHRHRRTRRIAHRAAVVLVFAGALLVTAATASARQLEVTFLSGVTAAQQTAALAPYGGPVAANADLATATINVDQADVDADRTSLLATDLISSVDPVQHYEAAGAPSPPDDPLYSSEWWMSKLGVPSAWNLTQGAGVTVAVVDEGMDLQHEDLQGQFVPGYDFVDGDADPSFGGSAQHATHVAGIIGAVADNELGIAGIAPGVKIMPIRVLDDGGGGTDDDIAAGITWAVDHGAKVINLSLGGPGATTVLHNAITYAIGHGAVVTCASGNSGDDGNPVDYPAGFPECLTVGAVDSHNTVASWSETGPQLDVVAPGVSIMSTVPDEGSGLYVSWDGTSMATPMVSAEAALLLAHGDTAAQAIAAITGTATDLGPAGFDNATGHGLINIAAALGAPVVAAPVPVCQGASLSVVAGADAAFAPVCTDPADATPHLTYAIVQQGPLGTASVEGNGTAIDYRSTGGSGTDTFTYIARDAEADASTETTVTVTIAPAPAPATTITVPVKTPAVPFLSVRRALVLAFTCGTSTKRACLIWKHAAKLSFHGTLAGGGTGEHLTLKAYRLSGRSWRLAKSVPVTTTTAGAFTTALTKQQLAKGEWRLQLVGAGGLATPVRYVFSL